MCTKFKNVTHCIFDMDGLLLDTEKLYSQATQEILDPYGKTYTWDVKVSVMGLQTQQVAEAIVDAYKLPISWEEYAQKQRDRTEILMTEAELMPGNTQIESSNLIFCFVVDTEVIYEEIVRQIAGSFNKPYPRDVRVRMLGTTEQKSAQIAVNDLELPITVEEYLKIFTNKCKEMLGNSPLMKG
uniref:Probable pseudouridine-5'-monophosphatase n=1 Tax=Zeugodacus cucurbitae TaxID=28588 RepID=A0A0A1WZV0_ZEUCU